MLVWMEYANCEYVYTRDTEQASIVCSMIFEMCKSVVAHAHTQLFLSFMKLWLYDATMRLQMFNSMTRVYIIWQEIYAIKFLVLPARIALSDSIAGAAHSPVWGGRNFYFFLPTATSHTQNVSLQCVGMSFRARVVCVCVSCWLDFALGPSSSYLELIMHVAAIK